MRRTESSQRRQLHIGEVANDGEMTNSDVGRQHLAASLCHRCLQTLMQATRDVGTTMYAPASGGGSARLA
ncbi:hypothetical protein SESBI_33677 [Sesbania bispinosa]|nr:hypothetical protein SESBI_33677 [Sesbania bispinosa]